MINLKHRRDPLTRADHRALRDRRIQVTQEAMTPAQIGHLMRKTIWEALDASGAVERADLTRANIPAHAVDTRFRTILAEVLAARAAGEPLPVLAVNWDTELT